MHAPNGAKYIYHQIKNHNYNYTGLFTDFAYQAWVGITTIAVWVAMSPNGRRTGTYMTTTGTHR
jgi:hypothetical protein